MRAQFIYEKFTQDTDPVHDLSIGPYKYIYDHLKPGDIFKIKKYIGVKDYNTGTYFRITSTKHSDYSSDDDIGVRVNIEFVNKKGEKIVKEYEPFTNSWHGWGWSYNFFIEYFKPIYIKESLNEKFEQDSDPVHDMGIGLTVDIIRKWLKENKEYLHKFGPFLPSLETNFGLLWMSVFLEKYEFIEYLLNEFDFNIYEYRSIYAIAKNKERNDIAKLIRYYMRDYYGVNEKFTQDSDPIHDMGIGAIYVKRDFKSDEEAADFVITILPLLLKTKEIPEDIIRPAALAFNPKYDSIISSYRNKYLTTNNQPTQHFYYILHEKLEKMGFIPQ